MKGRWWIGLGVAVTLVVIVGFGAGWLWWERTMWRRTALAAPEMVERASDCGRDRGGYGMMGSGMMEASQAASDDVACDTQPGMAVTTCGGADFAPDDGSGSCVAFDGKGLLNGGEPLSPEDARAAVAYYLERLDDANLEIDEVMEFESNFYAIVKEANTGTGAMELLVDKRTGAVGPEVGPNMMWNARYGMRRRGGMMGQSSETNTVTAEEAVAIAQTWLDEHRPGATAEDHADPFYGYYTIHTLRDGEIEGMLSVHGTTGQVWYHTWHGDFVQMVEGDE